MSKDKNILKSRCANNKKDVIITSMNPMMDAMKAKEGGGFMHDRLLIKV